MNIPDYPNSREITIEDKPIFDRIFSENPPDISAYTFTNIFAWRNAHAMRLSQIDGCLVIADQSGCMEPLGSCDAKHAIDEVFRLSMTDEIEFKRVHARVAELVKDDPGYIVEYDRDDSDYLYLASDLIDLKGRKYDGKRNWVSRFKSEYDYEYVRMPHVSPQEAIEFADYWCEQRDCRTNESLKKEYCAVYEMLSNFDALGIIGGAIKVNGSVAAFSLGEALNPQTLVIHVEKAGSGMNGIYQTINNEFATHEGAKFEYINREQDLGIPGLRKAKSSYCPVKMVETYRIRRA
ncbi:MAG: phosphatidylglycerol lysyltransferase domain-containing protein [Armatimonadota bacterium]|nr:phosphatidylglycerol lysyltransferase domain-containing protein [bacterium]